MRDPAAALVVELKRLSPRDRDRLLNALTAAEREQLVGILQREEEVEPSFEALAAFSPWVLKTIDEARSSGSTLKPATRKLLLRSFEEIARDSSMSAGTVEAPPSIIERLLRWTGKKALA